MAFINDYLTEEEIERFRGYNLKYHKDCSRNHKILGTVKCFGKVYCTVDRERKIYLFNCGDNSMIRRDTLEPIIYFALVMEDEIPHVVYACMDRQDGLISPNGAYVNWKLIKLDNFNYKKYTNEDVLFLIKEALSEHGYDGDPEGGYWHVTCDF